jgi:cytochrome c6
MRRVVLIFAALVLAFPIAGCGGGDDEDTAPADVETTVEETTTEDETTTEEGGGGGGGGEGDAANGKQIFAAQGCGSCHVLADAGSSGTVGPNLDDSQPEAELVVERVTNGSGAMPSFSDKLSEQEINDVAAYVSTAAGGS